MADLQREPGGKLSDALRAAAGLHGGEGAATAQELRDLARDAVVLEAQRDVLILALRRRLILCACENNRCTVCLSDRTTIDETTGTTGNESGDPPMLLGWSEVQKRRAAKAKGDA